MVPHHLFISYAREDRAKAEELAETFKAFGWPVWWDRESIPPGVDFAKWIADALDNAGCVLVLWSPHSVQSVWVREEANRAKRDLLIPAMIADAEPPMPFGGLQTVDLTQWKKNHPSADFDKLVARIQALLSTERVPPPPPPLPWKWILAGLVSAILVIGLISYFTRIDGKGLTKSPTSIPSPLMTQFTALMAENGPQVQQANWEVFSGDEQTPAKTGSGPVFRADLVGGAYRVKVSAGTASREERIVIASGQPIDKKFVLDAGELVLIPVLRGGGEADEASYWLDQKDDKEEGGWRRQVTEGGSVDQHFILRGGLHRVRGEAFAKAGKRYYTPGDGTEVFIQSGQTVRLEVRFVPFAP